MSREATASTRSPSPARRSFSARTRSRAASAGTASGQDPAILGDTSGLTSSVCSLGPEILQRIARGVRPDRGGDIQLVPREPNFVRGGLSHAGPWDYLQRIPMLWYGPGYVRPGSYDEPVTLADVAPSITLVTGAIDDRLNEVGYIVPGLGDAGDRLYGLAQ